MTDCKQVCGSPPAYASALAACTLAVQCTVYGSGLHLHLHQLHVRRSYHVWLIPAPLDLTTSVVALESVSLSPHPVCDGALSDLVSRTCLSDLSFGLVFRTCLSDLSFGLVSRTSLSDLSFGLVSWTCLSD